MGYSRNYILTGAGVAKLVTIILGIIVVIIGLRSHFESAWVQYDFHKSCRFNHYDLNVPCPDIAMERFYVAVIVICTLLSFIGLTLSAVLNPYNVAFWIVDMVYHGLSSVLLFIGAILHIVSAIKISQHPIIVGDDFTLLAPHVVKLNDTEVFLSTQKIIAGILTIVEAFVFIVTMNIIRRSRSKIVQCDSASDTQNIVD